MKYIIRVQGNELLLPIWDANYNRAGPIGQNFTEHLLYVRHHFTGCISFMQEESYVAQLVLWDAARHTGESVTSSKMNHLGSLWDDPTNTTRVSIQLILRLNLKVKCVVCFCLDPQWHCALLASYYGLNLGASFSHCTQILLLKRLGAYTIDEQPATQAEEINTQRWVNLVEHLSHT